MPLCLKGDLLIHDWLQIRDTTVFQYMYHFKLKMYHQFIFT